MLNIPPQALDFYADADLDEQPTIRLSTIHAAKGHEADRVVLLTDMTTRVTQTAESNPDDEIRVFYVGMTRSKNVLDIVEGFNGFKI
jgi:superfamily I DNA/RNA helicase